MERKKLSRIVQRCYEEVASSAGLSFSDPLRRKEAKAGVHGPRVARDHERRRRHVEAAHIHSCRNKLVFDSVARVLRSQ